jgi:archaeal flagellar protein FlaI
MEEKQSINEPVNPNPDQTKKVDVKEKKPSKKILDSYKLNLNDTLIDVNIVFPDDETVPRYNVSITNMSATTKVILEKIREEFISQIGIGVIELSESGGIEKIKSEFRKEISALLKKYFPNADKKTKDMLINYVIEQNLGLGHIEILLMDKDIEEIVVNNAKEPVWIYHRKFAWLKTNIIIPTEQRIRHFSTMIGRDVNKEITLLSPLMDAHLLTGDRVNATLEPISTNGNTITIRKFAADPWTVTDFIKMGTFNVSGAAIIWLCVQHELPILLVGGTGSGKTSTLNVISSFIPPNQRVISIEDTRELQLPQTLHWVPLETRLPNPEGKGGVSMLDLIVNCLRMRPDRILMGEIRRKKEAEVLFEAMHTGHSVYGTFHANNAEETITRLTNPPIDIPKLVIPALAALLVMNRNRRTNKRRMLQFAEVLPDGEPNIILELDVISDDIKRVGKFKVINQTLKLFTGMTDDDIEKDLAGKEKILNWLVKNNVRELQKIGMIMSKYYRGQLDIK